MVNKKTLLLRACKNDFSKIVDDGSKFRYLEVKKYWESRLLEKNGDYKDFDLIKLQNGYSVDSPISIIEFKANNGIVNKDGINYFEIEMGEILEVNNYKK